MATFRRNRIVTFTSPGMAACNSFCSQPKTFNGAMYLQRFYHIMRTGRFVAAVFREDGRDKPLIKFYQDNQWKCDDFVEHCIAKIAK